MLCIVYQVAQCGDIHIHVTYLLVLCTVVRGIVRCVSMICALYVVKYQALWVACAVVVSCVLCRME